MNLNSYEAKVLGEAVYLDVAKKHNLTTKKHTIGRLKEFKKEIKYLMELATKIFKNGKKKR